MLWELRDQPMTYGELHRACEEMSTSVLATRLRELSDAGILARRQGRYGLTPRGRELLGHLAPLNDFAKAWRRQLVAKADPDSSRT